MRLCYRSSSVGVGRCMSMFGVTVIIGLIVGLYLMIAVATLDLFFGRNIALSLARGSSTVATFIAWIVKSRRLASNSAIAEKK